MYPILFQFGPVTIYAYGLLLAVAFIISSSLARAQAKKEHIPPDIIFNFCFICLACGVIGARIFYVLENIGYYLKAPLEAIMLQHGGLSWYGGLISGFFSGVVYLRNKKIAVYPALDLIAPFVALAQAIGRLGCLLNGCCFGKTLVPIQVYSSLVLLLIFIILRLLQEQPHKAGQIFFVYLFLYSLKRFFIEFWRLDNPLVFCGLTLFQVISVGIFSLVFLKLFFIHASKE